jgi:peptidoglycan/xylan/chitin deacetylase (PgdA/CDA1 family)
VTRRARLPALLLALLLALGAAPAALAQHRFASIAFHDVVEHPGDRDEEAVTVDRLIAFFEWLRASGWTPIGLDDVARAQRGERPLPPRAILVTFDDGYRSLYTRVFPLVLAYRMPIVVALTGAWMDAPMDAKVRYGDNDVPRDDFISWDEAREMQRSGLVEFMSHGYDLHRGVPGNPQGNMLPAAAALMYSSAKGYETDDEYRARIGADLAKSRALMQRELGRAPRALAWPFGRYTGAAQEAAAQAGFAFLMTLDPEPSDARTPLAIARYLPTRDPTVATFAANLAFEDRLPSAQRLVCLDPAALWSPDPAEADARLGKAIERLRTLGATTAVVQAATRGADGRLESAWFPTRELPLRGDFLSRLAWQIASRAGVEVFAHLPVGAAHATLGDRERVLRLFSDLGAQALVSGLVVRDAPGLVDVQGKGGDPWTVRRDRAAVDAASLGPPDRLALEAFRAVERWRPGLRLVLVGDAGQAPRASGIADLTLVPTSSGARPGRAAADRLGHAGLLSGTSARRVGLWLDDATPPADNALVAVTRRLQRNGGTAIGWCPDAPVADLPAAAAVAPTVSSSTFPVKY